MADHRATSYETAPPTLLAFVGVGSGIPSGVYDLTQELVFLRMEMAIDVGRRDCTKPLAYVERG